MSIASSITHLFSGVLKITKIVAVINQSIPNIFFFKPLLYVVGWYAGCKIGHIKWNVFAYADDIVLMAPSLKGSY